ncbi:MAG TPA: NAD(P)-dependent glycerol-1-phosphate dehydrogenase [Candidatus Bathyarchaeia archaeon]|nr:NAD(P)-dependent glycerol-1-phosphate dehydrogenase [Candidatus Bathyarchaeia archaeon]
MVLNLHRMQLPREVVVGNGTLDQIGPICKRLGFSKSAMIVMGPKTMEVAGRKVMDMLKDAGLKIDHLVVTSCNIKDIVFVEDKIEELKPQVVLGIGGGTKIDVAKISASHKETPFISVPTTASHDGIASPLVSLKGLDKPYSLMAQSPMAIVADTNIIINSSYRFTASGCADVISKLTSVRDWRLAHEVKDEYYGEYAADLASMSARLMIKNARLLKTNMEEGLRVLLEALISCGVAMSIAGSSRPCSGSEHLFGHALDQVAPKPALHGEQCGVGTIMMARLHNINWRQVRDTLKRVEAPTTAEELGVEPDHIVESLIRAAEIRPDRYTILDERTLTPETAKSLAKTTGVI